MNYVFKCCNQSSAIDYNTTAIFTSKDFNSILYITQDRKSYFPLCCNSLFFHLTQNSFDNYPDSTTCQEMGGKSATLLLYLRLQSRSLCPIRVISTARKRSKQYSKNWTSGAQMPMEHTNYINNICKETISSFAQHCLKQLIELWLCIYHRKHLFINSSNRWILLLGNLGIPLIYKLALK